MKNTTAKTGEREHLGSRLGFILLSAGCAIGIGNVWKFPWMAGQYGGGIFVLFYFLFLALLGIPVLTMEFAMGRAAQKSPTKLYQALEKPGHKWHFHGYVMLLGNYLLMMFYTTVAGWMLQYFVYTAKGDFVGATAEVVSSKFSGMLENPWWMILSMGIVVLVATLVCSFKLQGGLERVTKILMIALLAIMVGLAIYGFTLDGAAEGLKFYLVPDFNKILEVGGGNAAVGLAQVAVGAMNQAFFTLSLGIGAMAIFGSYLKKERTLLGEAVNVAVLDTFVAITSGLIIFPACFTYGIDPAGAYGPGLIFETLPYIFGDLPGGRIIGSLFFVFLAFAALSTVFAVFENIVASTCDLFGWSRRKACLINGGCLFLLSTPCIFGFNLLSGFNPFGGSSTVMDLEDFVVSQLLLPLGSLLIVIFCVCRYGWGWDKFVKEANEGKGLRVAKWMRPYMTYVLPVIVGIFFVVGIMNFDFNGDGVSLLSRLFATISG